MASTPLRAFGQSNTATTAQYAVLISQAVVEFNYGNWAEARSLFEQAHAIQPTARTARGLGLTSFELRHYVDAIAELQLALEDQRNSLNDEQRSEVARVIERARGYVGSLRVTVVPENAALLLDGAPVVKREFTLNAGDHELAASAAGYRTASVRVYVAGGQERIAAVTLVRVDADAHAAVGGGDPGVTQRVVGWSVAGAGVVGLAVGLVFRLQRSSKLSDRDAICPTSVDCTLGDQQQINELTDQARTASTISTIGLIAGAALVAGGVTLLLVAPKAERSNTLALTPRLGPHVQGLVLSGGF